ncbi:hypothetical protein [Paenibacillus sp. FSL E2-0201]|uniref:hypothetical protein n=1 Tax=Paenibacillus sp. FSL E2-0201 TaxID=2954726 RepID=UPI0030D832A1
MSDHIFDSEAERGLFIKLTEKWEKFNLRISHHLPCSKIIKEIYSNSGKLTDKEKDFLKVSDFDFVILSGNPLDYGKVLLIIEFDGLGSGYSTKTEYVKVNETEDPYRKLKLDLKLRICKEKKIPIVVISWDEISELNNVRFTIADAIIADVLAFKSFNEGIENYLADALEYSYSLGEAVRDYEFISRLEHNPLAAEAWLLFEMFLENEMKDVPLPATIPIWGNDESDLNSIYSFKAYYTDSEGFEDSEIVAIKSEYCGSFSYMQFAEEMAYLLLLRRYSERKDINILHEVEKRELLEYPVWKNRWI